MGIRGAVGFFLVVFAPFRLMWGPFFDRHVRTPSSYPDHVLRRRHSPSRPQKSTYKLRYLKQFLRFFDACPLLPSREYPILFRISTPPLPTETPPSKVCPVGHLWNFFFVFSAAITCCPLHGTQNTFPITSTSSPGRATASERRPDPLAFTFWVFFSAAIKLRRPQDAHAVFPITHTTSHGCATAL